ncbi:hypothetical protein QYE76_060498 [Lolium multiflorum]|uniref:Polysaccharide biosynthesis domain-containing protein n=1 Tax=Lolium multiflorum TaxID=4521 RepID=A0AAD8W4B3_LOLMU|nr:hypothetical protein QYE76_060498 [Lolium multiflorum]
MCAAGLTFSPHLLCPAVTAPLGSGYEPTGLAALADPAVYYATTPTVPQQSRAEIALSLAVLRRRAPARVLVFGLGHDSPLWHALNPSGVTVFLEEDPKWYRVVRSRLPFLRAHLVSYRTRLDQADRLLESYRRSPSRVPGVEEARARQVPQAGAHVSERLRVALVQRRPGASGARGEQDGVRWRRAEILRRPGRC